MEKRNNIQIQIPNVKISKFIFPVAAAAAAGDICSNTCVFFKFNSVLHFEINSAK